MAAGLTSGARAATDADATNVAPVVVVASTPVGGSGVDADKLPGEVQVMSVPALLQDRRADVIASLAGAELASVSLNNEQGSPFQPDFTFRGFEASPISGIPEGLAVYQDGVRLNEAFGDNVNWDLIPEFAVDRITVESNNPAFGLNALGGAVTLEMKSGLRFEGVDAQLSGGSFGNVQGDAEYGGRFGDFGLYLGAGALHDDGFRHHSPATLRQLYGDLAFQHGPLTLHLSIEATLDDIAAVGPTPVQLLARDPKSVFTRPQFMQNQSQMAQLRGAYALNEHVTLDANAYFRRFEQHLADGNTTDVALCHNDPSQFCLEGADDFPGDALYDTHGDRVPASVLPAGATPGWRPDVTRTVTEGAGAAAALSLTWPLGRHANNLVVGASIDQGWSHYSALGELGVLEPDLDVVGAGVIIDQGLSPTAQPPIEEPVDVSAENTYVGIYGVDVFDITDRLSLTLSGRWNSVRIALRDQAVTDLNAEHRYARLNPGAGFAYRLGDDLTGYVGYSESNRAPTAGELSCANPASPCLLDAFLVSDPDLKQVVSRNFELGVRGRASLGPGAATWNVSAYRNDSQSDIFLLATDINGFGFFQNSGTVRRQGVDANVSYRDGRWRVSASYTLLDATFRQAEVLSSNSPAADDGGLIHVRIGDHLPLSPADRLTMSADYDVTPNWSIGADLRGQSSQFLVGDESNQERPLPGFVTVNLRTLYTVSSRLELFSEIQNLFNARYDTYGTFTALDGLPPNFRLTDPKHYSPSEGLALTVGARVRLR